MMSRNPLSLILLAAALSLSCLSAPDRSPPAVAEPEPAAPSSESIRPAATEGWLYGSWRIDKDATLKSMADMNGMDLDSLPPEQKQEALDSFNMEFKITLEPGKWEGILVEGAERTEGSGTHTIEPRGKALIMTMNEDTGNGLTTNRIKIERLEMNLLKMYFLDEGENIYFILRRQ